MSPSIEEASQVLCEVEQPPGQPSDLSVGSRRILDMEKRPCSVLTLCSGPAMCSLIHCNVNDSYRIRVAPGIDLAVESYLPCDYTPCYKASIGPRPPKAAIIFLHDFGGSSYIFRRIIRDCRCHCITVDFRGCGQSSRASVSRLYSVE